MPAIGIAVIGAGPWGQTLTRAFAGLSEARVRWICELDDERRAQAGAAHPGARLTGDADEALHDPAVTAGVVAVDPARHHDVAMRVLAAGKHVFVEKPLALSVRDASAVHQAAAVRGLVLGVGHVLLHHEATRRARQIVAEGVLGGTFTFESSRTTPGAPRRTGSAWWALAPHDISLALHLFAERPASVTAAGAKWGQSGEDNAASAVLHFADGLSAHIEVARFAPRKRRATTIAGPAATLTFDELAAPEQSLRLWTPQRGTSLLPCDGVDALAAQCRDFLACVARGDVSGGNGAHAVDVVAVLEAGERSMRRGGAPQAVAFDTDTAARLEAASFEAA